jgi:DNA-binding phage protein
MIKVKDLKRWDAAESLNTPERQAEFLRLVLADGDADEIRDARKIVARARRMASKEKAAK